jgi:geranylgeranyl pyrophosphate synthase
VLMRFVAGGKCLRSTFMYLGWLAGAQDSDEALFASAGLELLHAFALLQDDVMDAASSRRGRPAAHLQFTQWHRNRQLSGPAERFGESAAILLGDLCLIWAEQMLRESGVDHRRLQQAWPRYDAMRTELALGQFADLASDIRDLPSMDTVLEVARRKSGNYTVRRPLIAAHDLADPPTRRQLTELMNTGDLDDNAIERWRTLIVTTGAVQRIEDMISSRVSSALNELDDLRIGEPVRAGLANMAAVCAERTE